MDRFQTLLHLHSCPCNLVTITLSSDVLGEFSEPFEWQIVGGDKPLSLDFRGRVVGPTFTVDVEELDFGIVSYGYRYTKVGRSRLTQY
jgi:hydrocephalus-inducing protein